MSHPRQTPLDDRSVAPHLCTVNLRLKLLAGLPFFHNLAAGELEEINVLFREQGFEPEDYIYHEGDPAERLFVVADGKVKLLRYSYGGETVLLDMLVPGEFFGTLSAFGDSSYAETAQAQTNCCVLTIQAADFQAVLQQHPSVAMQVLRIVAERLHGARETIQQLSTQPVESRIAMALLRLADKLGEEAPEGLLIQVPLSRQDLADMTGTTLETASRVISQLRTAGVLRSGRQWIAITDQDRLAALARGEGAGGREKGEGSREKGEGRRGRWGTQRNSEELGGTPGNLGELGGTRGN